MNKWCGVGRLTRDPEMKVSQSGNGVVRFNLAVDRTRKVDGQPDADFISCVAFGNTAEFMDKYIKKGYLVSVEGRITTGSYEKKDGTKVYTTDIYCDSVQNLTPKNVSETNTYESNDKYQAKSNDDYEDSLDISTDDLPF